MEPTFLTIDEVLAIHRDQIAHYGGSEGVRDWGVLQSAINDTRLTVGNDAYADLVLAVARGEAPKSAVAEFFRANTMPV